MRILSPIELKWQLDTAESRPFLLDVREPREYAYCHIEGSLNIPMNDVPERLGELDPACETVVVCHHGIRSASVAGYLVRQGFRSVANLAGGIEAWAVEVEPDMSRY